MSETPSLGPQVSLLEKGYLWDVKASFLMFAILFCVCAYKLIDVLTGGDTKNPFWLFLLPMALLGWICWYLGRIWKNLPLRSISFDAEGLWLTHVGKERGFFRWADIYRIKEDSFSCQLSLFTKRGGSGFKVEYKRDKFQEIQTLIMEGMQFQPPSLPAVFEQSLGGRVVLLGMMVVFTAFGYFIFNTDVPFFGAFLMCLGILMGALVLLRPLRVVVEDARIRGRRREVAFSEIRSVSIVYWDARGQMFSRVKVELFTPYAEPLLLKGLNVDSMTLQRTVLWAMDRWRLNGSAGKLPE